MMLVLMLFFIKMPSCTAPTAVCNWLCARQVFGIIIIMKTWNSISSRHTSQWAVHYQQLVCNTHADRSPGPWCLAAGPGRRAAYTPGSWHLWCCACSHHTHPRSQSLWTWSAQRQSDTWWHGCCSCTLDLKKSRSSNFYSNQNQGSWHLDLNILSTAQGHLRRSPGALKQLTIFCSNKTSKAYLPLPPPPPIKTPKRTGQSKTRLSTKCLSFFHSIH